MLREKQFVESAMDSLSGLFCVFETEGRFLRWNKNLESVTGYSGGEIRTLRAVEFFALEDQPDAKREIGEVFTKGANVMENFVLTNTSNASTRAWSRTTETS